MYRPINENFRKKEMLVGCFSTHECTDCLKTFVFKEINRRNEERPRRPDQQTEEVESRGD